MWAPVAERKGRALSRIEHSMSITFEPPCPITVLPVLPLVQAIHALPITTSLSLSRCIMQPVPSLVFFCPNSPRGSLFNLLPGAKRTYFSTSFFGPVAG